MRLTQPVIAKTIGASSRQQGKMRNPPNPCLAPPGLIAYALTRSFYAENCVVKKLFLIIALTITLTPFASQAASWPDRVSRKDHLYLRELMQDTWNYIDYFISPDTGLPYDSNEAKDITNTTNIGLYLTSLCMAYKLGYITEEHALARITRILDTLDTYENWDRLYTNWIDPEGKNRSAKPGESNISDYNKLPAGLIVVRQTFPQLESRCTAFLDAIPWDAFYEESTGKIRYAFDVQHRRALNPVYLYRGEDKVLAHFLMIASGKVPASSWDRHDLADEEKYGFKYYKHGWQGGGLFMQFICDLFLDNRGTPLGKSAVNFAWVQMLHAARIGAPVWGWSACVAPNGKYLGMGGLIDEVVTPHASVLTINLFPSEVVDNLKRLEEFGLRKPALVNGRKEKFGFRDGINWKNAEITDKYLILDQCMLFLSLVNYCERGMLWRTFDADPMVQHGKQVIADYRAALRLRPTEHAYIQHLSDDHPNTFWMGSNPTLTCRPGDILDRSLWAKSLSTNVLSGFNVNWSIMRGDGTTAAEGSEPIVLEPRETRLVSRIIPPLDKAVYGDIWTFHTELTMEGQIVRTSDEKITFPRYRLLSGKWKLQSGDDSIWAEPTFDDSSWTTCLVPCRWEDGSLPEYDGYAWYRLHFTIPASSAALWTNSELAILIGAVDDADETYLNGKKIGATGAFPPAEKTAYNEPRLYPIPRELLKEENILAVRVADFGGNGGIWRGPVAIGPADELQVLSGTTE